MKQNHPGEGLVNLKAATQIVALGLSLVMGSTIPCFAETAEELFAKGQTAYANGQAQQAIDYFEQATKLDENFLDAYFNKGALYFNQKRYPEAMEAFQKLLQRDPKDQSARYELGRIFDKMGRTAEALSAFQMIDTASPRYAKAQDNIARLKAMKEGPTQSTTTAQTPGLNTAKPVTQALSKQEITVTTKPTSTKPTVLSPTTNPSTMPVKPFSFIPQEEGLSNALIGTDSIAVQEVASGFYGPTGLVMDASGMLYVANFSKNTIEKISPTGKKELLASGTGIQGPVGMVIDSQTGDLYIANHLDNSISKVAPSGKVSVVATGLKKPYNLYLDQSHRMLYVSQQETNSIAKVKLN